MLYILISSITEWNEEYVPHRVVVGTCQAFEKHLVNYSRYYYAGIILRSVLLTLNMKYQMFGEISIHYCFLDYK